LARINIVTLDKNLESTKDSLSEANDEIFILKGDIKVLEEKLLKIPILETVIESCYNESKALKE
jgi:hypothetical protein